MPANPRQRRGRSDAGDANDRQPLAQLHHVELRTGEPRWPGCADVVDHSLRQHRLQEGAVRKRPLAAAQQINFHEADASVQIVETFSLPILAIFKLRLVRRREQFDGSNNMSAAVHNLDVPQDFVAVLHNDRLDRCHQRTALAQGRPRRTIP